MLLIGGTIPIKNMPLVFGPVREQGDYLEVDSHRIPRLQGTGAMISAALKVTAHLNLEPPHILVAGDIGEGDGTREIYRYLVENIEQFQPKVLALHYCLPIMTLMRRLCQTIDSMDYKPFMIADAGAMYAAKAAGLANNFDIFTPDPSEIAFLADKEATHPAYISRHLFSSEVAEVPGLVSAAYEHGDAARMLLVKGKIDYIVDNGKIVASISEPDVPALEAVGGTGDTITGLISGLIYGEIDPVEAAIIASRTNRVAGQLAIATPATKVRHIIDRFPSVFERYLCEWSEECYSKGGSHDRG